MDNCGKATLSRKCDRKQKRCQHIIEKETGIKCTLMASKVSCKKLTTAITILAANINGIQAKYLAMCFMYLS